MFQFLKEYKTDFGYIYVCQDISHNKRVSLISIVRTLLQHQPPSHLTGYNAVSIDGILPTVFITWMYGWMDVWMDGWVDGWFNLFISQNPILSSIISI